MKKKCKKNLNERHSRVNYGKLLYITFLCVTLAAAMCLPAFAATPTIWEKATEIMKDVYNQILPLDMQMKVLLEIMINPWYFLREICRIPEDGKPIEV